MHCKLPGRMKLVPRPYPPWLASVNAVAVMCNTVFSRGCKGGCSLSLLFSIACLGVARALTTCTGRGQSLCGTVPGPPCPTRSHYRVWCDRWFSSRQSCCLIPGRLTSHRFMLISTVQTSVWHREHQPEICCSANAGQAMVIHSPELRPLEGSLCNAVLCKVQRLHQAQGKHSAAYGQAGPVRSWPCASGWKPQITGDHADAQHA
jgi:hypothetical protein